MFNKIISVLNDSAGISDPRMNRFLMRSPLEFLSVISLYIFVIYKAGPQFMKNRKPFSLRPVLITYNIIQIIWNASVFLIVLRLRKNLNILCTNYDTSNSESNLNFLRGHYSYLLLKYFDLVETVFYVLRKKNRQVSFLHVYHHLGILLAAFVSGKYFPGGQAAFVALYNTLIHCIMYCYYLYACWYPTNGSIWWKKYITALQIIQHCLIFLSIVPSVLNVNCSYPKGLMGLFSLNVLFIIYLFIKFYKNTYLIKMKNN